jgi:hypothetical protein
MFRMGKKEQRYGALGWSPAIGPGKTSKVKAVRRSVEDLAPVRPPFMYVICPVGTQEARSANCLRAAR